MICLHRLDVVFSSIPDKSLLYFIMNTSISFTGDSCNATNRLQGAVSCEFRAPFFKIIQSMGKDLKA